MTEEEQSEFDRHAQLAGVEFAFRSLWRSRVHNSVHMTKAEWAELRTIAYNLGIEFPV